MLQVGEGAAGPCRVGADQEREVVKSGDYYGPVPRKLATTVHADNDLATIDLSLTN
jgi:hypothetical protein